VLHLYSYSQSGRYDESSLHIAKKGASPLPAVTANTQAGKYWVIPMTLSMFWHISTWKTSQHRSRTISAVTNKQTICKTLLVTDIEKKTLVSQQIKM